MKENKSVYIRSLEANDIYSNMFRDREIDNLYLGMIPYSLELIKLYEAGLVTRSVTTNNKLLSDDIINVKFNQKVQSGGHVVRRLEDRIKGLEKEQADYRGKLEEFIDVIHSEKNEVKWNEVSNFELRDYFYENGFYLNDTYYVTYKRSSSKSRTGQCLFIKESLHEEMVSWSRMGLDFQHNEEVDLASLLAYESLVGSSIIDTIEINAGNILIVDDVISKFNQVANVVRTNEDTGFLDSFTEETEIINDIFDGQSLIEGSYFNDNQGFMLLRNHFFKSAAFNTNIQQFLRDNCPEDVEYDEWKISNMFGQQMYAKDVEMITTPNSLKALNFSHKAGSKVDMWEHWKKVVAEEGSVFGICQYENTTSRGKDNEDNLLQQTSYQMVNSLPLSREDIVELTTFERKYVERLKNDDEFFIDHIEQKANDINSNMMLVDLYRRNSEIVQTKLFRDFRSAEINRHVTHVKRGKFRLSGDYVVMLGNGYEMLKHAIDQFNMENTELSLMSNEVHTTLFPFDKKLTGFRNPHTSPSNVLIARNTYNQHIDKYFNLTDNIVVVNAVRFALQDTLSGSDYDSDTVLLFDNKTLLERAESVQGYHVCINHVESEKRQYRLNMEDMSTIDKALQRSGRLIGEVVNLGQEIMSMFWDTGARDRELMKSVDVMTILSGISIDLAKQMYDLDIGEEVARVKSVADVGRIKPEFFKYISQSNTIRDRVRLFDTPMDYLQKEMDRIPVAKYRNSVDFDDLLVKQDKNRRNRRQQRNILDYVEDMVNKINYINTQTICRDEKFEQLDDVVMYCSFFIGKMKVNERTMYALVDSITNNNSGIAIRLLNILYKTQEKIFLKAFKETI